MAVTQRGQAHSPLRDPRIWLLMIFFGGVGLASAALALTNDAPVGNPMGIPGALRRGALVWSTTTTVVAIALAVLVIGAVIGIWVALKKTGKKKIPQGYFTAARSMATAKDLSHVTEDDAQATGQRLVPKLDGQPEQPGIKLGKTLNGNTPLYLDWESTMLVIAGTRMGKTSSIALPALLTAPGAVVATSNKPDVYDLTKEYRREKGKVWIFDPQNVTRDGTNFWWNPLSRVSDVPTAQKLTGWLTTGAGISDTANQANKYFQDEGERVLACLILAAALGGGDLKHVYDWLKDIQSPIPVMILKEHGHEEPAADIEAIQSMESRQRDGVIGFARQPVALLAHQGFAQFATPENRVRFGLSDAGLVTQEYVPGYHEKDLEEFDLGKFAESHDALYALSLEGKGSAAGLTTALCGEVFERAVEAASSHGGRLPVPMVAVLDEACNVCKLGELPQVYSHWGSRGLIPMTIVQSPAQAKGVWGAEGWDALKSAASVVYYGGAVFDEAYLGELSKMIGEHEVVYASKSTTRDGHSTSRSVQRELILGIDDLAALPKQLAVVQSPGNHPTMVRKNYVYDDKLLRSRVSDG